LTEEGLSWGRNKGGGGKKQKGTCERKGVDKEMKKSLEVPRELRSKIIRERDDASNSRVSSEETSRKERERLMQIKRRAFF